MAYIHHVFYTVWGLTAIDYSSFKQKFYWTYNQTITPTLCNNCTGMCKCDSRFELLWWQVSEAIWSRKNFCLWMCSNDIRSQLFEAYWGLKPLKSESALLAFPSVSTPETFFKKAQYFPGCRSRHTIHLMDVTFGPQLPEESMSKEGLREERDYTPLLGQWGRIRGMSHCWEQSPLKPQGFIPQLKALNHISVFMPNVRFKAI